MLLVLAMLCAGVTACGASDDEDTCFNGVRDGRETDVDCGGDCRACAGGRACAVGGDCFSGNCTSDNVCYSLPEVTFAAPVSYRSGAKPYFVRSADLDSDGDVDLLVGNEQDSAVVIFRNTGFASGRFERVPPRPARGFHTGDYPTGGAVVDLDRDGVLDVITADYRGNSVSVLLGRGSYDSYTLAPRTSYPTAQGAETSNLAVGDLDGDGYPDVVATNPKAHSVSVFRGGANGSLTPVATLPCGETCEPYSTAIGDLDGDDHDDVAFADDRSGTLHVWLGNGDATFRVREERPAIGGMGSHIMVAHDMNLDGVLDVAVANRSSHDVSVLIGNGDGTFAAPHIASNGIETGPYAVAIADFNLDAVPDLVTPNYKTSTGTVHLGQGDGDFDTVIDMGTLGETSYGVATGDFNGDLKPDVAAVNAISGDLAVVLSTAR
ncbi:MAG: VCBS repeat-containing protein [Kofleriaceae bacterium]|nr:VCBS repeat-containing protein [Kofleriaceae bacterium]